MPTAEYQLGIDRDSHEDHKREKKCQDCDHCGWDPDGNYCAAPEALKESMGFGLYLHRAREAKGPCGPDGKLWIERTEK